MTENKVKKLYFSGNVTENRIKLIRFLLIASTPLIDIYDLW